jgi:hypothetical protein
VKSSGFQIYYGAWPVVVMEGARYLSCARYLSQAETPVVDLRVVIENFLDVWLLVHGTSLS